MGGGTRWRVWRYGVEGVRGWERDGSVRGVRSWNSKIGVGWGCGGGVGGVKDGREGGEMTRYALGGRWFGVVGM